MRVPFLKKSSGLMQSAYVAVGNVAASGLSAISLIILSRYLGPQEFGGFSVAFSLTQLVARILDLGFNQSLNRYVAGHYKTDERKSSAAITMVGYVKLTACCIAVLLGVMIGPILSTTIFHVSNPLLITLGIMMAVVVILYEYVLAIVQSLARFTWAILINGIQAAIKCSLAIISYLTIKPDSVIAYSWYGLAPLVATAIVWATIPFKYKHRLTDSKVWAEIIRVMKFSAVGVLAAAVGDNVDILMVNAALSELDTGLYSAAARIALMVTLFGMSFGTVFNTRVASYKNSRDLHSFTLKAIAFALGSLALIPISFLLAKPLILITAGPQYLDAISSLNLVMASSFVMMSVMPFIAIFYAVDYPAYFAISGIIQTVVLLVLNAILIPAMGIEGAGLAKLITRSLVAVYTIATALYFARKQFHIKIPSIDDLRSLIHA